MLTTSVSNQTSFGVSKYNLADYNRYRSNSAPIAYYNDNSAKGAIANLADIFLGADVSDLKNSHNKKPKRGLFYELEKLSQIIVKTYHVLVADKLKRYTTFTDKIL